MKITQKNRFLTQLIQGTLLSALLLSSSARANVLGDMQTFAPNTDGLDFITVHSARSLNEGHFAFSNYLNIAKDHLLVFKDMNTQETMPYNSFLSEYDFGIAYGLAKHFQVSMMMPVLLTYSSETKDGIKVDVTKGIHSYRPGFKWSFYESSSDSGALLVSADIPQVINSPYTGVDPKTILNIETAFTLRGKEASHGFNLGYRNRQATAQPLDGRMFPLKDQLIFSYGYAKKLTDSTRFIFELFGSHPLDKEPYKDEMNASSYDVLFGLKHFWWKYLRFDWGLTVEPGVHSLAPTWRAFAGLVYYWKNDLNRPSEVEEEKNFAQAYPPGDSAPLSPAVEDFEISPKEATILEGEEIEFTAKGGKYPYDFKVVSGPGSIDSAGFYQAPAAGKATIEVKDQIGQKRQAQVTILPAPKADKEISLRNLKFEFDKDVLISESRSIVAKNADQLKKLDIREIVVEGHTDHLGSQQYNYKLGLKRAAAVKNILVERLGLSPSQVKVVSFGKERPLATNKTAKGRQINRRVELKVYFNKK